MAEIIIQYDPKSQLSARTIQVPKEESNYLTYVMLLAQIKQAEMEIISKLNDFRIAHFDKNEDN